MGYFQSDEPLGEECPGWPRTGCCQDVECHLALLVRQPVWQQELLELLQELPPLGPSAPKELLEPEWEPLEPPPLEPQEPLVLLAPSSVLPLAWHLDMPREVSSQPAVPRWMIHP